MPVKASHRYAKISPQKARLVVDMVRGLAAEQASQLLQFTNKKAAPMVKKVVDSAIANAEHNHGLDADELYIHRIMVDMGPSMTRFRARAKGRGNSIKKRTCHITVELQEKGE